MDKVYVVYLDGEMYRTSSRKTAYLEKKYAKQIITCDAKKYAEYMYDEENKVPRKSWWDLSKEEKQKWINKAKDRFEIIEFVRR